MRADAKTVDEYISSGQGAKGDVHKEGLDLLMKMKPGRDPFTGRTVTVNVDGEEQELQEFTFKGLVRAFPDEDEDEVDQFWAFDLWETLDLGDGKFLLPKYNMNVPVPQFGGVKPSRGGGFAEWLAIHMIGSGSGVGGSGRRAPDISRSRQMSPPPLYLEGHKVQTQWLYEFLLEPYKLRHETVLRMPRFNMSKKEAQTLSNYFAAADGVPYPYQEIKPRDRDYLMARTHKLTEEGLLKPGESYLNKSWSVLTGSGLPAKDRLCAKCHAVGGEPYAGTGTDDIRGPNLQYASNRLRSDWLHLWLYNPSWVTPYTSMPVNFNSSGKVMPQLFEGHPSTQVTGVRDALMNYYRLMETQSSKNGVAAKPVTSPATGGGASSDAVE